MPETREEIVQSRQRLKAEYGKLFERVAELLFRHDPVNINCKTNNDEYEPEVGTILPRLRFCRSVEDARQVVHEEFVRWFDKGIAGPQERYAKIAAEIWREWQKFKPV